MRFSARLSRLSRLPRPALCAGAGFHRADSLRQGQLPRRGGFLLTDYKIAAMYLHVAMHGEALQQGRVPAAPQRYRRKLP